MESDDSKRLLSDALSSLMFNTDDYLFVKDMNLVYRSCSVAFAHMAGKSSQQEILGKTDYDFFDHGLAEKYRKDDAELLKSGKPIIGMLERIPDKNGKAQWTKTWKYPIYDAGGVLVGMYGVGRDVSLEMELQSEAKYARRYIDLITHIPGGVAILHQQDGVFFLDYANEGYFSTHHMSRAYGERFMGPNVITVVVPGDRERIMEVYEDVCKCRLAQGDVVYRTIGEDGAIHWIGIQFCHAYQDGGITYFYASFSCYDEQKRTEEALLDSQRELKDAISNSDVQYFTYYPASHSLEITMLNKRYGAVPFPLEQYPDRFVAFADLSSVDRSAYLKMVAMIDSGAETASCIINPEYHGIRYWEKVTMSSLKDEQGSIRKVLCSAVDITERKKAEERLRTEKVRLKTMEGNVFEAFSFNLTKNSQPTIQTFDDGLFQGKVSDAVAHQALELVPALEHTNSQTRDILLRAASRIPDEKERERFIITCSGNGVRNAMKEGRYTSEIRYRRYIGKKIHWVVSHTEVLPDPESGDMIAFFYTRDINTEVVDEMLASRVIGLSYETVSYCDLQTDILVVKSTNNDIDPRFNGIPYVKAVEEELEANVASSDRETTKKAFSMDTIRKELETKSVFTFCYAKRDGKGTWKEDIFYLNEYHDVVVFLLSDVTAVLERERKNQEQLSQALAAAKQANAAKSEFLSRMSHDIRTPLNGIIGLTYLAAEEQNPPRTADYLKKIDTSSLFLLGLVNDILDMTKAESNKITLHPEPYPLEEFHAYMDAVIKPLYEGKNQRFELKTTLLEGRVPVMDKLRVNQVIFNLLSNAVKYTPEGGLISYTVVFTPRADSEDMSMHLSVSDNGIGMSETFQKVLFQPFTQEGRNDNSELRGSGLGLAITKKLVDVMGGTITVRSALGKGTTFEVDLRVGSVDARSLRPCEKKVDKTDIDAFLGKHVLLCEDHPLNQEIAKRLLEQKGMIVEVSDNGWQALMQFKRSAVGFYDVILMDIRMPVLDGYNATKEIRSLSREDAKTVPIIAMTADAFAEDVEKCRECGMNEHISKPIEPVDLYKKLAAFMK